MINNNYHEIRINKGRRILIDLAKVEWFYEVAVLVDRTGIELEMIRTKTENEGVRVFLQMLEKYPADKASGWTHEHKTEPKAQKPLTGKYAKLRDDLKKALAYGKLNEGDDDGGTCNLDACAVDLPRWNEKLVEQAAREAGTNSFTWSLFRHKRFVFIPNTNGQANKRSHNAEAMTVYMKSIGYDALDYSQMD